MANKQHKNRLKANNNLLLVWLAVIVGTLLAHFLLHHYVFEPESTGAFVYYLPYVALIVPYLFLYASSRPAYDAAGKLISGGAPLTEGFIFVGCFDLMIVAVAATVGQWLWSPLSLLWLFIPGYGVYKGASLVWGTLGTNQQAQPEEELDPRELKRQKKKNRVRYQTVGRR